jgi:hypothetical protein
MLFMLIVYACSVLKEATTIPIVYNQPTADLVDGNYTSLLIIAEVEKVLHIELGGRDIFDAVHAYIIGLFC